MICQGCQGEGKVGGFGCPVCKGLGLQQDCEHQNNPRALELIAKHIEGKGKKDFPSLNEQETHFLFSMRYRSQKPGFLATDKQMAWLEELCSRISNPEETQQAILVKKLKSLRERIRRREIEIARLVKEKEEMLNELLELEGCHPAFQIKGTRGIVDVQDDRFTYYQLLNTKSQIVLTIRTYKNWTKATENTWWKTRGHHTSATKWEEIPSHKASELLEKYRA